MLKENRSTLVLGDIHGRLPVVLKALSLPYNIVFVGDFLDSFTISIGDQVECLIKVMDAIEQEPDRVAATMGNHELSYIEKGMRCSGWHGVTESHVLHLETRMRNNLKPYIWEKNHLISHAGVANRLLKYMNMTLEDYLAHDNHKQIGPQRGGYNVCGGLYWCDWWKDFDPRPALTVAR